MDTLCHFERQENGTHLCRVCGLRAPKVAVRPVANCYGLGGLPQKPHESQALPTPTGPGTELKALLRDWLGIEASPTCSCNAMARRMETLGPDWCESEEGMASILEVMRAEHGKRWADGRTILPWTDLGARQLVLLACRRARANG